MEERVAELERTVADLSRALRDLTIRVTEAERRAGIAVERGSVSAGGSAAPSAVGATDAVAVLSLVGRSCVVLGGAYLLRALTDAGTLPRAGGTALGLAYAVGWFVAAWKAAGSRRVASGAFHTVAAVLTAFPLLFEATVRVHLLSHAAAAAAMAGVTAIGLAVAWQRRVQTLAWIVTCGGIFAGLAFMTAGGSAGEVDPTGLVVTLSSSAQSAAAATLYLAFLGVVTLWFSYRLDWTWLRWPTAIVVDVSVVAMLWGASDVWHREQAGTVMLVQLLLFAGYVVSFTARTLWRSRDVVPFEVVQTIGLLLVCFGGAVYLMLTTGSNAKALGVVSLFVGAGSYAAAFAFIDWRRGRWKNFVFYASLGAVFAVAGTVLTVATPLQAIVLAALAAITAWAGYRYATITLSSHATIYTIAAAIVSGLLAHATDALSAPAASAWTPLVVPGVVVLGAAMLSSAAPLSGTNESWGRVSRLPKVVLVIVLLWTVGGAVCGAATPWLAGVPGSASADAAVVASIRTVIVSTSVLLLAWAGGGLFVEGRWLSYVLLLAGAVKLLVEDFPNGRPSTLFLSLAVYGGALIVGPRLRARAMTDAPRPSSRVEPV